MVSNEIRDSQEEKEPFPWCELGENSTKNTPSSSPNGRHGTEETHVNIAHLSRGDVNA